MSTENEIPTNLSANQDNESLQQPSADMNKERRQFYENDVTDAIDSPSARPHSRSFFLTRRMKTNRIYRDTPSAPSHLEPHSRYGYQEEMDSSEKACGVSETLESYNEGYSAGHRQGYRQGYQKGYQWGYQQGYQMALDSKFKTEREGQPSYSSSPSPYHSSSPAPYLRRPSPFHRESQRSPYDGGQGWGRNSFERSPLYRDRPTTSFSRPTTYQAQSSQAPAASRIFRAVDDFDAGRPFEPSRERLTEYHEPLRPTSPTPTYRPLPQQSDDGAIDEELLQLLDGEGK